jgi:DNA-binding response OmpR family regulator
VLTAGSLSLDPARREVRRDDTKISLTHANTDYWNT